MDRGPCLNQDSQDSQDLQDEELFATTPPLVRSKSSLFRYVSRLGGQANTGRHRARHCSSGSTDPERREYLSLLAGDYSLQDQAILPYRGDEG